MSNNNTISDNLIRLNSAKTAIANAITAKGGTVNEGDGFEDFADDIRSIPTSGGGSSSFSVAAVNSRPITDTSYVYYDKQISASSINIQVASAESSSSTIGSFYGSYICSNGQDVYFYFYNHEHSGEINYCRFCKYNKIHNTWIALDTIYSSYNVSGADFWFCDNVLYYSFTSSSTNVQKVFNNSTLTWENKTWTGLTSFNGRYIWTDGQNIYYSFNTTHYVLNKDTQRWTIKSWTGLTSFYGSSIWTDGENIYYSYEGTNKVLNKSTSTWSDKTWSGLTGFEGSNVWTDGDNIYYSSDSTHYILNKDTNNWTSTTWSGLTRFYGSYIWICDDDVYCSSGNFVTAQYKLNKSAKTWESITFYSTYKVTFSSSSYVWNDNNNTYYSYGNTAQGIFDNQFKVFFPKTWTGLTNFYGSYIWTDGTDIYYSSGSTQYVLDTSTSTWTTKTWTGLTSFSGNYIWTDGTNIYYSSGSSQYVLDKSTSKWSTKTWTGLTSFYGNDVWTDGINIYCINSYKLYILDMQSNTWNNIPSSTLYLSNGLWTDGENIYNSYSYNSTYYHYIWSPSQQRFNSTTTVNNNSTFSGGSIWTDGDDIYIHNNYKLTITKELLPINTNIKCTVPYARARYTTEQNT